MRVVPAVDAQNRLLRIGDKEIATSMIYMADHERETILALLGLTKGARVRQELERQQRSRIVYDHYEIAVRVVIRALEGARSVAPRTYYRPTRSRTR
jgi:hypothetical protein